MNRLLSSIPARPLRPVAAGAVAVVGAMAFMGGGCGTTPATDHARLRSLRVSPVAITNPAEHENARQTMANAIDPAIGF